MAKVKQALYKWNGEPCGIEHIDIKLDEKQNENTFWFAPFSGKFRRAIRIHINGETFVIDNEDGMGVRKVRNGGTPNLASRHYDKALFTVIGPTHKSREVHTYNHKLSAKIERISERNIKKIDPEKYKRMKILQGIIKGTVDKTLHDEWTPYIAGEPKK